MTNPVSVKAILCPRPRCQISPARPVGACDASDSDRAKLVLFVCIHSRNLLFYSTIPDGLRQDFSNDMVAKNLWDLHRCCSPVFSSFQSFHLSTQKDMVAQFPKLVRKKIMPEVSKDNGRKPGKRAQWPPTCRRWGTARRIPSVPRRWTRPPAPAQRHRS